MILNAAEIEKIVSSAGSNASTQLVPGRDLRRMLEVLAGYEFSTRRAAPLAKLCNAGADYGWRELERAAGSDLLHETSTKARESLRRHLRKTLETISGPSFELEWTSFTLAMSSLGLSAGLDATTTERMFLRDQPSHRLFALFRKFPVLASHWCLAILRWRNHVLEVLQRVAKDRSVLSQFFVDKENLNGIEDVRLGLSDSHDGGRSVTLIEFKASRRVIYKPRSGRNEAAWFSLLAWMNRRGFRPRLQVARILLRDGYYWMEYVEAASCENEAAARRFYKRIGGLIAAAYLLRTVDCHRQNVIAAGEYPVLVDIDALWHVSPLTKTQSPGDVLYRTGFFPNSKRHSLQSRSSVLGKTRTGKHLARLAGSPTAASDYTREIVTGFTRAWNCILGTPARRAAFLQRLHRIRSQSRRWIYRATERYAAIIEASIQPAALRSIAKHSALVRRSCVRDSVSTSVVQAEIAALLRLDIPYFVRKTNHSMPIDKRNLLSDLLDEIRISLDSQAGSGAGGA
jgi:lantibiotic modifying enzyme